ncbi:MAG: recombinase family protein, partial [Clostridia bacterium]|nr:recombinase family protein [Clostridia bacterium]
MITQAQLIYAAQVLIYLRKSRSDDPNETVEEVLKKHETELQEYAEHYLGGPVPEENVYREVISAESIDAREEFRKLLARLEDPEIRAVLVVDPQRLSRGDLGDSHRLLTTFALTKTMILTRRMGNFDLSNDRERKFFQDELLRGRDYYEYTRRTLWA